MERTMRYIDFALAWIIFTIGVGGIVTTELFHKPFQVLDTPLLCFLWRCSTCCAYVTDLR